MTTLQLPNSPFTADEIAIIMGYLFRNIATENNILSKVSRRQVIKSIPGAVIASPSIAGPDFSQDYYYDWMRDAALTMNEVTSLYEQSAAENEKTILRSYLVNYVNWVKNAQSQPSLNGISVLGEPKFNIDGTVFTGDWARPQNDGPALRAITLIHIANIALKENDFSDLLNTLYNPLAPGSLIKTDLEYTAKIWSEKSIELWEEVLGFQFFTLAVQRKALFEGANLAYRMEDSEAADYYREQARFIEKLMDQHWHDGLGYYNETLTAIGTKGGGLTISVLMGLLYGRINRADDHYAITNEKSLSNAYYTRYTFEGFYQINIKNNELGRGGPLIGRYQNDIYDGYQSIYGHPWFLSTNLFAEFYYTVAEELIRKKEIEITSLNKQFYRQACPDLELNNDSIISKESDNELFYKIIVGLLMAGDNMLKAVKKHSETYEDGTPLHMSEQIDRSHGNQVSAQDLTWSYCTTLTALQAREKLEKILSTQKI